MPDQMIHRQDLLDGKELVVIRNDDPTDFLSHHTLRLELHEKMGSVSVRVQSLVLHNGLDILAAILNIPPPNPADAPKIYRCEQCGAGINELQFDLNEAICFECGPPSCIECGVEMSADAWYKQAALCTACS